VERGNAHAHAAATASCMLGPMAVLMQQLARCPKCIAWQEVVTQGSFEHVSHVRPAAMSIQSHNSTHAATA
jgi:hypothetical protein